jgi:hypothetical protein
MGPFYFSLLNGISLAKPKRKVECPLYLFRIALKSNRSAFRSWLQVKVESLKPCC